MLVVWDVSSGKRSYLPRLGEQVIQRQCWGKAMRRIGQGEWGGPAQYPRSCVGPRPLDLPSCVQAAACVTSCRAAATPRALLSA